MKWVTAVRAERKLLIAFLLFLQMSFLFSPLAFALPSWVELSNSRQIYLKAPDCEALSAMVDAIQVWNKRRGEAPEDLRIDCEQTSGLRKIEITSILPKAVQDFYGISPICDGPNCWNWSLFESKLSSALRFVGSDEWNFYLKTYCKIRNVERGEMPVPGDIAAIRNRNEGGRVSEVHGFIYIDQMACTKNGYSNASSYLIEPIEDVFDLYNVGSETDCRVGLRNPPDSCETYVNYYSCSKEQGKSLEELQDYEKFIRILSESQIFEDIEFLVVGKSRVGKLMSDTKHSLAQIGKRLDEISSYSWTSREVSQLRDVVVASLKSQVAFIDEVTLPSEFSTGSEVSAQSGYWSYFSWW